MSFGSIGNYASPFGMNSKPKPIGMAAPNKPPAGVGIAPPSSAPANQPTGQAPGVYPAHVEMGMSNKKTAGGGNQFQQDATGWGLNPANPDNSYDNRTSPADKEWNEARLAGHPYDVASSWASAAAAGKPRPAAGLMPDPANNPNPIGVKPAGSAPVGVSTVEPTAGSLAGPRAYDGSFYGYRNGDDPNLNPSRANGGQGNNWSQINKAVMGDIDGKIAVARANGDSIGLIRESARKQAHQQGGVIGLQNHDNSLAMDNANLEKAGALTNKANGKHPLRTEAEERDFLSKSGKSEAEILERLQGKRTIEAQAAATASGKPVNVQPGDADYIMHSPKYSHVSHLFDGQFGTDKAPMDLYKIHSSLKSIDPSLMNDPSSEFSQAAVQRIRSMYGDNLAQQLFVPAGIPEGPQVNPALGYMASVGHNLWNGDAFNLFPQGRHDEVKPSVDWFNRASSVPR